MRKIAVIGAGSWGTALAGLLAGSGSPVTLWAREQEIVESVNARHQNALFLDWYTLPENVRATNDMPDALENANLVVVVVPSEFFRSVVAPAAAAFPESAAAVVSATKGIEDGTFKTPSQMLEELLPSPLRTRVAALSGPSFAVEVARRHPTTLALASKDLGLATDLQKTLSRDHFRVYATDDLVGVEIGGAVKNVMAIAAGTAAGLGFGYNTLAAIITRGLAEMNRLAVKMGANPLTLLGLAGVGDLVLTCSGPLSRNRTVGQKLGEGMRLEHVVADMRMVAEGVRNARSVYNLSRKMDVDTPICAMVYRMLYENLDAKEAVTQLMGRSLKKERDF